MVITPFSSSKTHDLIKICFFNKHVFFFIADLCSAEHLPEVEIFSLLEEQIPKYKLRADVLTQFGGYENQVTFATINIRAFFLKFRFYVYRIGLCQAQRCPFPPEVLL